MPKSPPSRRWMLTAFLVWLPGLVHVFPLLGVYMLMFNKAYGLALFVGFALTGLALGLIQALTRGLRALWVTPASFVAGWSLLPLLMTLDAPFGVAWTLTLFTSAGFVALGQWMLRSDAPA
ncbi:MULTISPECIES: hypothetical protein [unclassified Corallococcus]|uniref:hypothetical protein n=1 Tax=unclassified Corallococcus TaxID=2685029 RepID=UPI001CBC5C18|nr:MULTISPECIES: hypothetical protein [unclassified Corallococcus]MBZ4333058.1 hypothetical protein [Corallococcus sp. AS-1-12]MBZ4373868.1 hypothetical protein [Corallococcus sp. AS-1-6]